MNKRKKIMTALLLILMAFVWYKIYRALFPTSSLPELETFTIIEHQDLEPLHREKVHVLNIVTHSPFSEKETKKRKNTFEQNTFSPIKKISPIKQTQPIRIAPARKIYQINFKGILGGAGKELAILKINDATKFLGVKDAYEGVIVKRIWRDSIQINIYDKDSTLYTR